MNTNFNLTQKMNAPYPQNFCKPEERAMPHVCVLTTAHAIDDMRVRHKVAQSLLDVGFRVSWVGPGQHAFGGESVSNSGIAFRLTKPIITRYDRLAAPIRTALAARSIVGVDVYFAPDPDAAAVAILLAGRQGARVIFDIHEIYHGALLQRWLRGRDIKLISKLLRSMIARLCQRVDLVTAVSRSVLAQYVAASSRGLVVRSCAPNWFASKLKSTDGDSPSRHFRLVHGRCHSIRGTAILLEAIGRIPSAERNLSVVVTVDGDVNQGREARGLIAAAQAHGVAENLELHSTRAMPKWRDLISGCDVGMIMYGRDFGTDSLPNRLFEYMAVGLPIIAPIYSSEIATVVDSEQCGILIDCEKPDEIAAAILELKRNKSRCTQMGLRGRKAFLERHCWEIEVQALLQTIGNWN